MAHVCKNIICRYGTTEIGLAYLRNGSATVVAPLTADHEHVAKALRLPLGQPGIAASPYMGISDLVKKWPARGARREVLLISSGIDPWSPPDPENPYLQKAIADAQRAGILVHSIYYAGGNPVLTFWLAYILTRPLGASLGDMLSHMLVTMTARGWARSVALPVKYVEMRSRRRGADANTIVMR